VVWFVRDSSAVGSKTDPIMTDETTSDPDEQISSDTDIYGAVASTDAGVTIQESGSRPDLPTIHEKQSHTSVQNANQAWSDFDNWWIVGEDRRTHNQHAFRVAHDIEQASLTADGRLSMYRDGGTELRFGHALQNPFVDQLVVLSPRNITDTSIDQPVSGMMGDTIGIQHENVIDRTDATVLESQYTAPNGTWLHGFVEPGGVGTCSEVFVPMREAEVSVDPPRINIEFEEDGFIQTNVDVIGVTEDTRTFGATAVHTVSETDLPNSHHQGVAAGDLLCQQYQQD
jgi:hypothetical protein